MKGKKQSKIIVFYYEWPATVGNHCGMAYFIQCLRKELGSRIKLIRTPHFYKRSGPYLRLVFRHLMRHYASFGLRPEDIFFFTEYLSFGAASGNHYDIALKMREKGLRNKIVGLVHYPPQILLEMFGLDVIRSASDIADVIIGMGSNLTRFFRQWGYEKKVKQTYLYVDTDFYRPLETVRKKTQFVVLTVGALFRNRKMLREIITRCPGVSFELCLGRESHKEEFAGLPNVVMNGFIPESELLSKMQRSDVSLSAFYETVGSNVITTSLACGLPQIVSDVGAIRDYCSEDNAIFCKNIDDFIDGIQFLKNNRDTCHEMGINARKKAEKISLDRSLDWYKDLFESLGNH